MWPAQAQAEKTRSAEVPGEAVYHYSAGRKVELVVALDELRVASPPGQPLNLRGVEGVLPPISVKSVEPVRWLDHLANVELAGPGRHSADLEAVAKNFEASLPGAEIRPVLYSPTAKKGEESQRQTLTRRLVVKLGPTADLDFILGKYRLSLVGPLDYSPNTYVLEAPRDADLLRSLKAANMIAETEDVEFAEPQINKWGLARALPNDSLFGSQWHLRNTGSNAFGGSAGNDINAAAAWDSVTGEGVVIAIVDDGLEHTHPDLAANYRADLAIDINGGDNNPAPGSGDDHGTACAGCAAAKGNNGLGVAGAAYDADVTGIRLIAANFSDAQTGQAMSHQLGAIDISSNSWGPADDGRTLEGWGSAGLAGLANGIANGRGGKGIIYTWAAGNGRCENDNVNLDGQASHRWTIAVGATGVNGESSWYSEPGASMLINSPSSSGSCSSGDSEAITTVDRAGNNGYDSGNYTHTFNGTSAACPIAAGGIALILEANPNLTWRDVQHILVQTSTTNDPGNSGWFTNGAGFDFNHNYGHGRINTGAAVAAAQSWTNVPAEAEPLTATDAANASIPDGNATGIERSLTISGPADFYTEHVEVRVNITHPYRGDLDIELTSPDGTVSKLMHKRNDSGDNYSNWSFWSTAHWGEDPNGEWKLKLVDSESPDAGTLQSWELVIYGYGEGEDPDPDPEPGEDCATAEPGPGVGEELPYDTTGHANLVGASCGQSGQDHGADQWLDLGTLPAGDYRLYTAGNGGVANTLLTLLEGPCPGSVLDCNDDINGAANRYSEIFFTADGTTPYLALVQDHAADGEGAFLVGLEGLTSEPGDGGTCDQAQPGPDLGQEIVVDTTGQPNNAGASCAGSAGSAQGLDLWLELSPGSPLPAGEYRAYTLGNGGLDDTIMTLYLAPCPGTELSCNDDIDFDAGDLYSEALFTADGVSTYYVLVQGYSANSAGSFIVGLEGAAQLPDIELDPDMLDVPVAP